MKRSELRQIIKEEIKKTINEVKIDSQTEKKIKDIIEIELMDLSLTDGVLRSIVDNIYNELNSSNLLKDVSALEKRRKEDNKKAWDAYLSGYTDFKPTEEL